MKNSPKKNKSWGIISTSASRPLRWQCHWSVYAATTQGQIIKKDAIYILHFVSLSRAETNTCLIFLLLSCYFSYTWLFPASTSLSFHLLINWSWVRVFSKMQSNPGRCPFILKALWLFEKFTQNNSAQTNRLALLGHQPQAMSLYFLYIVL